MNAYNPHVDNYLKSGCGRCPLGGTPECKVHNWTGELRLLRDIVLESGLTEEVKWGAPCYTLDGKNVVMISALKEKCVLSFMKGGAMDDPHNLLEKPGPNSRIGRIISFTNQDSIIQNATLLAEYIAQAIDLEKRGVVVPKSQEMEPLPEELEAFFEEDSIFQDAFYKLTPGRQRGYILHFSQPKQSKTRISRIEKHLPNILNGIGLHDR